MNEYYNLEYEYIITARRAYCPKCNSDYLHKKGTTFDGRQIVKCIDCGKKSTLNARKRGEQAFDKRRLLPIHLKDPLELNTGELYSMGFIIADGSLSKTNQLSITIKPNDIKVLEIIKNELHIDNKIRTVECTYIHKKTGLKHKGLYSRITWAYKFASPYWNVLGLYCDKTSNEIWLPYMNNNHFVRGLWDGDGGFGLTQEGILKAYYSTASLNFAIDLSKYINTHIGKFAPPCFFNGCYNLYYDNKDAKQLEDFLYESVGSIKPDRKYNKYNN